MPRHNPAASGGTVVLDAPPAAPAALPTPASPTPNSQLPTAGTTGIEESILRRLSSDLGQGLSFRTFLHFATQRRPPLESAC